jgi:DNA-binding cell septation regulator SpoVG
MKVTCIKKPVKKQENYSDILTPVTKAQRDDFMKQVSSELSSEINSDDKFVYINDYLAISKQQFT